MAARRLRICFVAPACYPVLAGDRSIPTVGGAEVQQAFLAPELARRGHDVSMICMDYGQREGERVKGVRLIKMHAPQAGLPVLRFLHPRLSSLWAAMGRADADVYYQRSGGALTGMVAQFAHWRGRRSVFASASDFDFDPQCPLIPLERDKMLFRHGVSRVDEIVVQSERQLQLCRERFGRDATCIASCYGHQGSAARHDGPIVWVGTIKPLKRPELFLDLAERLPQYRFRLVGGAAAGDEHYAALQRRAGQLGNVEMMGFVPFADVEKVFDGASLLVNTSTGEGFPNTFLQAWSRGMPTVSFFDAGATMHGAPIGVAVPDLEAMILRIQALKADHVLWRQHGEPAQQYFLARHDLGAVAAKYEAVFCQGRPFSAETQRRKPNA
jgi:glycosyltransferase involved in cell wall biosynthesis